jgi:hypothetical protein
MTMALIALIAAAEAMLFSASGAKRNQARRQQVLMGNSLDSVRALPPVDEYRFSKKKRIEFHLRLRKPVSTQRRTRALFHTPGAAIRREVLPSREH